MTKMKGISAGVFVLALIALVIGAIVVTSGGIPSIPLQTAPGQPGLLQAVPPPGVCAVSPELEGKSSTVDVLCYDKENNDPFTQVGCDYRIYKNGAFVGSSSAGTTINSAVGDQIRVLGGNSSIYVDENPAFCVDSQRPVLELNGHTVEAESGMQVTCYDSTGSTTLSGGTNGCLKWNN